MAEIAPAVEWHVCDRKHRKPPIDEPVWIVERFYYGVTLGYYDGTRMRTWRGNDDCSVSHWAAIPKPEPPTGAVLPT